MRFDSVPTQITHHPTQRLDYAPARLPKPGIDQAQSVGNLVSIILQFTGVNLASLVSRLAEMEADYKARVQAFKDALTGYANSTDSDLDNWLLSLIIGDEIPASSITTRTVNLQRNHNFASASILQAEHEGDWSLDEDNRKGLLGNGLKVVGGGFNYIVLPRIRVSEKQGVTANAYVKWEGVSGPAASVVAYFRPIGGPSSDWQFLGNRAVSGTQTQWVQLGGDYTVVDRSIEFVELILSFTDATAGTVWFSETSVIKPLAPGTIPGILVDGLGDGLDAVGEFTQSAIAIFLKVLTGLPFIGWIFDDLEEAVSDFFDDTQVSAARADDAWTDNRSLIGHIVEAIFSKRSVDPDEARLALDSMRADLIKNTKDIQAMQARDSGQQAKGKVINVDFSDYPDGPLPSTLFDVNYTGPGTSLLVIKDGVVQWDKLDNRNRDAMVRYKLQPTATNFQVLRGSMAGPPEDETDGGRPHFYARGRVSADDKDYVWARAWSLGTLFQYRVDIGYAINGVETTWVSQKALTWSMDLSFVIGVGTNSRQYQVFSGNTLVWTHTETIAIKATAGAATILSTSSIRVTMAAGHGFTAASVGQRVMLTNYSGTGSFVDDTQGVISAVSGNDVTLTIPTSGVATGSGTINAYVGSAIGPNHRYFGSLAQLRQDNSGVPNAGGKLAAFAVADNELPATLGTNAMMYRTSTVNEMATGGEVVYNFPSNFFGFVGRSSRDIAANPANGTFIVQKQGLYRLSAKILLAVGMNSRLFLGLKRNGTVVDWNDGAYPSNGENAAAEFEVYCYPDDVLNLCYTKSGGNLGVLTGEASGTRTKFSIYRVPDELPAAA